MAADLLPRFISLNMVGGTYFTVLFNFPVQARRATPDTVPWTLTHRGRIVLGIYLVVCLSTSQFSAYTLTPIETASAGSAYQICNVAFVVAVAWLRGKLSDPQACRDVDLVSLVRHTHPRFTLA
jgi:hypothetical protein